MKSFKEIIGAEPIKNADDTYWPSEASMKLAVHDVSDYDHTVYPNAYKGVDKRVLVLCTEDDLLECQNGKVFKTGNHPEELFVVLLHLEKAGFQIDMATLTGRPVKIEEFAMPTKDEAVVNFRKRYESQLMNPLSMLDVYNDLSDSSDYVAVFIPGGHGALIDLPFSEDSKSILQWFKDKDKYIITICHGPSVLLSLSLDEDPNKFPFKGYKMEAFPDSADALMTTAGYLPGELIWHFGEKLKGLGVEITSTLPVGDTRVDRKLISGDSPMASNKLGKLAANTLLESVNKAQS